MGEIADFDKQITCAFSGHRKGDFDRSLAGILLARKLDDAISRAIDAGCVNFLTGMAMGFDIFAAEQILAAGRDCPEIRLFAILPFRHMARKFPAHWRRRFDRVLMEAESAVVLSENHIPGCYYERNRFLINNSARLICYYDGMPKSGTAHTHCLAVENNHEIVNLFCD